MPITTESVENFERAPIGIALYGVLLANGDIHLSLAQNRDGTQIDNEYWSKISGETRSPLPGHGGHKEVVCWAGGNANQIDVGVAVGDARGFSIIKKGTSSYEIGTFRSGFNGQYLGERPAFAKRAGERDALRTLEETEIFSLLSQLNKGVIAQRPEPGGRQRAYSI